MRCSQEQIKFGAHSCLVKLASGVSVIFFEKAFKLPQIYSLKAYIYLFTNWHIMKCEPATLWWDVCLIINEVAGFENESWYKWFLNVSFVDQTFQDCSFFVHCKDILQQCKIRYGYVLNIYSINVSFSE